MHQLFSKNHKKYSNKLPILWILKAPQTLRFLVILRIQPHFHPISKGDGLSRSERAVKRSVKSTLKITTKAEASKAITKINIAFQEMQHHHTKMNVMIQWLQLHIRHSNTQNISMYSFSPIDRSYYAKNFSDFVK
ncbi:hypothetical protein COC45_29735 [Bacillus cereus]|nr:hypothetical protein COJ40_27180 [Bacillus cereus]PGS03982.1 hypothetical protein COC45_29735 [Bacillus cereus]